MTDATTFLYFAYGSNLLKERLQVNNPSASFVEIACLKDHELVFSQKESKRWRGGVATVSPRPGGRGVWGALWRMDAADRPNLDRQEGCGIPGRYTAVDVSVETASGDPITCLSYILHPSPVESLQGHPSPLYKAVIVAGATHCGLPLCYIDNFLRVIEHNGCVDASVMADALYETVQQFM